MKAANTRRRLDIYVLPACLGYHRARQLANHVRRWGLPDVEVRLIDLSDPTIARPASVFAVPTYLLDERVLCLGNPDAAWLCQQLAAPATGGTSAT